MPSIRVSTKPIAYEQKAAVAKEFTVVVSGALKVPSVELYFDEYEEFFLNGENRPEAMVTIMMDGPTADEGQLRELCAGLSAAVRESISSEAKIVFIYHANAPTHVGIDGVMLADRV